jgi:gamma-glutamylcyclotransferase (GGCT)/AIG2-like uncharacterized protein YtfP
MQPVPYFAYGTTQRGFAHHLRLARLLGEPVARVRTCSAHAVVVPRGRACSNPACQYVHRMAVLVPGHEPCRVEGDLFLIGADALAVLDDLEAGSADRPGPYRRVSLDVVSIEDSAVRTVQAYAARDAAFWISLVQHGHADALAAYPSTLAADEQLKDCCRRAPRHPPPHDVVEPGATRSA